MTLTLTVVLGIALLASLFRDYKISQLVHEERKSWQLERANLLQRIQAPQVAVIEHNQQAQPAPGVQHAMTDEAAAEAEERARVIAEMERLENEALR